MKAWAKRAAVAAAAILAAAAAAAAEPSGAEIIEAVYARPQAKDTSGVLTMTLVDSRGKERVRTIRQLMGSFGRMDKKIMTFLAPADVRGTTFMNWSYDEAGKGDDQWIYLPALKRVKRISSEGRGDSFMGSDFSYDDLGERHPSEDTHKSIGSESVDGEDCWVVESVPRDQGEIYSRTVTWVSKARNIGVRRDYYDKRGALQKTLRIKKAEKISGYWTIVATEMRNVQKGTSTRMDFSELVLDDGVGEDSFTERAMTRGL